MKSVDEKVTFLNQNFIVIIDQKKFYQKLFSSLKLIEKINKIYLEVEKDLNIDFKI